MTSKARLYRYANRLVTALRFAIVAMAVAFVLQPSRIEALLQTAGLPVTQPFASGLYASLFAAAVWAALDPGPIRKLRITISQRLHPVNVPMRDEDLNAFLSYGNEMVERLSKFLPEEIRRAEQSGVTSLRPMPWRGEMTHASSQGLPFRALVEDVTDYLRSEYLGPASTSPNPVLVEGDPGSGKSTLLVHLFAKQVREVADRQQGWICVFVLASEITLSQLENAETFRDFLIAYAEEAGKQGTHSAHANLMYLLGSYASLRWVAFLDGLDEITDRAHYNAIVSKLGALIADEVSSRGGVRSNRYIISCRTDDNQHLIHGTLLTLLPLPERTVLIYLDDLARFYSRGGFPVEMETVERVSRMLRNARSTGLLQNYVSNPFLLSLILKYYEDAVRPASRLNEIFADVLDRELRKPGSPFESETEPQVRSDLRRYVSSVMAPYCFARLVTSLTGKETTDTEQYIRDNSVLSQHLFGTSAKPGYVRSLFDQNIVAGQDAFLALGQLWGEHKAQAFRTYLLSVRASAPTVSALERSALRFLHSDVLLTLANCNLAEVDPQHTVIRRFRHRRLQDYFLALQLEQLGPDRVAELDVGNAWMREPLRILAAVTSTPHGLFASLNRRIKSLLAPAEDEAQRLNDTSNLLLNAAEAVAYLPRPVGTDSHQAALLEVMTLGETTQALYHSTSQGAVGEERRGWLNLRLKLLRVLQHIYASEFLRTERQLFRTAHAQEQGPSSSNNWRALHRSISHEAPAYQHIAYGYLYPIKRIHHELPIGRLGLFLYVVEAVSCFRSAYQRLIVSTHPHVSERIPTLVVATIERVLSIGVVIGAVALLWNRELSMAANLTGPWMLLGAIAALLTALVVQRFGLMQWRDTHHAPIWLTILAMKLLAQRGLRAIARFILLFVRRVLAGLRWMAAQVLWLSRHPRELAAVAGVLGGLFLMIKYAAPAAADLATSRERATQALAILDRSRNAEAALDRILMRLDSIPTDSDPIAALGGYNEYEGALRQNEASIRQAAVDAQALAARDHGGWRRDSLVNTATRADSLTRMAERAIAQAERRRSELLRQPAVATVISQRTAETHARQARVLAKGISNAIDSLEEPASHRLQSISRELRGTGRPFWTRFAPLRRSTLVAQLQFVDTLSTETNRLTGLISQFESHLSALGVSAASIDAADRSASSDLMALTTVATTARQFKAAVAQWKLIELDSALGEEITQANRAEEHQLDVLARVGLTAVLLIALIVVERRLSDRHGLREVERQRESFSALLAFVERNSYSLRVNEQAVEYLRNQLMPSTDCLQAVSNAADRRLQRPGELNERVGLLLREVALGLDNVLNRRVRLTNAPEQHAS